MKEHIYSTDEYEVKICDPVVDAEVKATSTSVAIPCAAIPDGKYLVSLEVNGTAVAFRDTFSFASGSCTVGDYTLAYSSYAVTVSTTSNNDVVRLKIEPVEVYVTDAMKAAVVEVSPPSPAELPAITDADNGKVLTANSGVWGAQEPIGKKFIVTLTPTALDYSGTMDKTETEISDAYEAGQQIVFRVIGIPGYDYVDVNATEALYYTNLSRWQMSAYLIMLPSTLIYIYNDLTDDGDAARYSTRIYPLTPAT